LTRLRFGGDEENPVKLLPLTVLAIVMLWVLSWLAVGRKGIGWLAMCGISLVLFWPKQTWQNNG